MLTRLALCFIAAVASAHAAGPAEKTFDLAISAGKLPAEQRVLRVGKGDAVRLRLASDAAGEIHVHGYKLTATLAPGTPAQLAFRAHATGRYRIEWHPAGAAGQPGAHHGPPLATLEVRPK